MSRDKIFDPFLDEVKGIKPKSSKKEKKNSKNKRKGFYGMDSFDFGDDKNDDDLYGANEFSSKSTEVKKEKVTLQTLFEFKNWEIAVLIVEIILVTYLILVVTRVVPLF